ncbi:MAG: hypothetical protein V1862_04720 [Methanobacteriota archaeon]
MVSVSFADEIPTATAYLQGGASSITDGTDQMVEITIKDIIPYAHITNGDKNTLVPLSIISNHTPNLNAAIVFSDDSNESFSFITISNMSLSNDDKDLILQVTPLKYYEGEALQPFFSQNQKMSPETGEKSTITRIYIESPLKPLTNNDHCECIVWIIVCWDPVAEKWYDAETGAYADW